MQEKFLNESIIARAEDSLRILNINQPPLWSEPPE